MRSKGFKIINYIDDYIGVVLPSVASASFQFLCNLMQDLGLTVSLKKLVEPSAQMVCLGVLIDTENATISILEVKLRQILEMVKDHKKNCTKRQIQSLLGLLLCVHMCIKPAHVFLNRMLEVLRSNHAMQVIALHLPLTFNMI